MSMLLLLLLLFWIWLHDPGHHLAFCEQNRWGLVPHQPQTSFISIFMKKTLSAFSVFGSWVWTRLKQIKRIKSSGWRSKSSASQSAAAAAAVDVGGQRIGRKRGGIDWKNYEPKFVEFSKGRIRQEVSLFFTFPPNLALILFSSEAMPFLPPRRKNIGMYQVLLTFKHYISPWLLWL